MNVALKHEEQQTYGCEIIRSLGAIIKTIGDRRNLRYQATIHTVQDAAISTCYGALELEFELEKRGFGKHEGDFVTVLIPIRS